MEGIAKACVGLAALCLVGAALLVFTGPIMTLWPESLSRASTNFALIALCLFIGFKDEGASAG